MSSGQVSFGADEGDRAPKVEILLPTFNGAEFLREQLDSLLAQDYPNLAITVRDDGSTDGTLNILDEYARSPFVAVTQGPHVGYPEVFFRLLEAASPTSEYFAFADQDDVWLAQKLSRAVRILGESGLNNQPALYCARCVIVDAALQPQGFTPLPRRGPSFANSLVQNIATGCTILLNRQARDVLASRPPAKFFAHDWWCYQVISGLGHVIYDPETVLLYRQHGANNMGIGMTPVRRLWSRIRRQLRRECRGWITDQANELRRLFFNDLPCTNQEVLDQLLSNRETLFSRLHYAYKGKAFRQTSLDNLAFKTLYIMNRT